MSYYKLFGILMCGICAYSIYSVNVQCGFMAVEFQFSIAVFFAEIDSPLTFGAPSGGLLCPLDSTHMAFLRFGLIRDQLLAGTTGSSVLFPTLVLEAVPF